MKWTTLALAASCAMFGAEAANDLFHKRSADSRNGFLAATDATYVKECGSCHFPYSPGLLPARSWELHMGRLERHFGESIALDPATHRKVADYLAAHAADRSEYHGSRLFLERLDPKETPYRLLDVPLYRDMHLIIREVIHLKPRIRVRTLTDCGACHQYADRGSFGNDELLIPGLTPTARR